MNKYYLCDNILICCKKFTYGNKNYIYFVDVQSDGLKYSYTINAGFSKKNIESFLKQKFKTWELK